MTQEQILKCAIVGNALSREQSIMWGVDCNIDFDNNIAIALRYLALLDMQDCGLEKPMSCEIDEFIKFLRNDRIYKCTVDAICASSVTTTCALSLTRVVDTTTGCTNNTMTIQRIQ